LRGGKGGDRLNGGEGGDGLSGGPGDDVLVGGRKAKRRRNAINYLSDSASYRAADRAVRVDLALGSARGQGHDKLVRIDAVGGSRFADVLEGNRFGNSILGGRGDDVMRGRGANDVASASTAPSNFVEYFSKLPCCTTSRIRWLRN
jgi:Ca2+-binding RTX toxin-like protein